MGMVYDLFFGRETGKKSRDEIIKDMEFLIEANNQAMLALPCPFNDWKNCTSSCVHFLPARMIGLNMGDEWINALPAECKLWK